MLDFFVYFWKDSFNNNNKKRYQKGQFLKNSSYLKINKAIFLKNS